jgi:hypothetical protein
MKAITIACMLPAKVLALALAGLMLSPVGDGLALAQSAPAPTQSTTPDFTEGQPMKIVKHLPCAKDDRVRVYGSATVPPEHGGGNWEFCAGH